MFPDIRIINRFREYNFHSNPGFTCQNNLKIENYRCHLIGKNCRIIKSSFGTDETLLCSICQKIGMISTHIRGDGIYTLCSECIKNIGMLQCRTCNIGMTMVNAELCQTCRAAKKENLIDINFRESPNDREI